MESLCLYQYLPADPEAVWSFITEPTNINNWSTALVEILDLGDGQEPGGIGARRQVTIRTPRKKFQVQEVIEHSQPPEKLVYRIFQERLIKHHRGEIRLQAHEKGTLLQWEVEYEFVWPILAKYASRIIEPQLRQSLQNLAQLVPGQSIKNIRSAIAIDQSTDLEPLWQQAQQVLDEQSAMAKRFEASRDPKFWFTCVYKLVTENQLDACRQGFLTHPAWVLRLICRFHDYYYDNLRCWLGEAPGRVEPHWQRAFQIMESGTYEGKDASAFIRGIVGGISAHIEEDLPRVLAEVYLKYYHGVCSYARIRSDYLLMTHLLRKSSRHLLPKVPRKSLPLFLRVFGSLLPDELENDIITRNFYNVPQQRLLAFERGERLANLITGWENSSFR